MNKNMVNFELSLRCVAKLLEEVDIDRITPIESDLGRESRLSAFGEFQGDMTIGHD